MDKKTFKTKVTQLIEQDVVGLEKEIKIKYMKKWIRDYERSLIELSPNQESHSTIKIGILVRNTLTKFNRAKLLTPDRVSRLQDAKYCKTTFDINYPFLIKVQHGTSYSEQRKVNGYDRYWADEIVIDQVRYFVCNDWYERNRPKFIRWVRDIESN
ncbi:hypothetical protein [Bacillus sp. S/N-304-OC-R1]|uniref:hypothetical protein n=1 Tax=Bacillus sp. S/N-304-OC-R1 TaxID=2758034 RepID=UPI001C8EB072|nr:hypothetical protein [Bacillus sp. S/N-304-OC-R1]MBY0121465.1 hypothetical protein [Bacillus sp. S/N-304-OC-R1]